MVPPDACGRAGGHLTGFLLLCAVVYLTERWLPLVRQVMVPERPKALAGDPMPADLLRAVNQESEAWARDQLRASIQEAYEELGDWQKVRVRFGGG